MLSALWQLSISFGQIGLFALGGGNSMIQLIEDECVGNRAWLSSEEFATLLGVNFLFPGLTGIKLAGFIGLKVAGIPGLIIGILALNLPGLVLSLLFYSFIAARQESPLVKKLVVAMQYGALALLASVLFSLIKPIAMSAKFSWIAALLSLGLFFAVGVMKWSTPVSLVVFTLICMLVL